MRVEYIKVEGLGRFGPKATEWALDGQSHVLVGPSNAGKSTMASALWHAVNGEFPEFSYFGMKRPANLSVEARLSLTEDESLVLASTLLGRYQPGAPSLPDELWTRMGRSLFSEISFRFVGRLTRDGSISSSIALETPILKPSSSSYTVVFEGAPSQGTQIDWAQLLGMAVGLFMGPYRGPGDVLVPMRNQGIRGLELSVNYEATFLELMKDKVRIFQEVRQRTANQTDDTIETWDGSRLGGVLGAMSSGSSAQRRRFSDIKGTFERMFHPLQLFPWRREGGQQWLLGFQSPGLQEALPPSAVGMGTLESLLLITNLTSSEDRVIVLEEPELHIHPPAQRALRAALDNGAERNQLIVVTHSPDMVSPRANYRISRLSLGLQPSKIQSQDPDLLTAIQPNWVRDYVKNALFATRVVLVEGPYDQLTIQNLLDILLPNWNAQGIAVVPINSKTNVTKPFRYLTTMGLDILVCLDDDALAATTSSFRWDSQRVPICSALEQAIDVGAVEEAEIDDVARAGTAAGAQSAYDASFVADWRKRLRGRGWVILSDTLDRLILKAVGKQLGSARDRGRRAEVASRTIAAIDIPAEIHDLVAEIKTQLA